MMVFAPCQLNVNTGMAPLSRLERLNLAALRLREIQNEAAAIYRSFPELDRRPKVARRQRARTMAPPDTRTVAWPEKLH
jgi:hypothetical protein